MIGIILLSHGPLASAFMESAQNMVGAQKQVACFSLADESEIESRRDELLQLISLNNTGAGVIIVTDMFGGLASHMAMSLLNLPRIEVISGMNLPMIVKLFAKRGELNLSECALAGQKAGQKYIKLATQILSPLQQAS